MSQISYWNDAHPAAGCRIVAVPMSAGGQNGTCPNCGSASVQAAIVVGENGTPVIPSADERDSERACTECGFWWD